MFNIKKNIKFIIAVFLIFLCLGCSGNNIYANDFQNKSIRVLLSKNGSFIHKNIILSSESELYITGDNNLILHTMFPVNITIEGNNFLILSQEGTQKIPTTSKLVVSTIGSPIKINNILKLKQPAQYIGQIELSATTLNKLRVINIIDIEDYIKGVVPNEMPVYFGLEALKAQAVAARGYAYRDANYKNPDFDVCDTTGSQVYNGYNSYHKTSNKAVDETIGQFALYDGKVILSLYSSTSGGHTENYENAFSQSGPVTKFPANPIPYLQGVADMEQNLNLSRENNAKEFYSAVPVSYENKSPKYRWEYTWSIEELQNILADNFIKYSKSEFIKPAIKNRSDFGNIKNIDVPKRGVSGKAMYVRITTNKGVFLIAKEIMIRKIFTYKGQWLPSANIIFSEVYDGKKLIGYKVIGGGFGHGVGMSQFGASGMATKGFSYDKILQHYYTGISIGSYPVECNLKELKNCKSTFYSKNKHGKLVLQYEHKPASLTFNINGKMLHILNDKLNKKNTTIDISHYLQKGINSIEIVKNDVSSNRNIKFYVELVEVNEK